MQEKIMVFDENDAPAGHTYYRRAKQLVAKGRAVWTDGGKTAIRLMPKENDEEALKMEYVKIDRDIESEELLRIAKDNVKLKRNFVRHLIIFAVALVFLPILLDVFGSTRDIPMSAQTALSDEGVVAALVELRLMINALPDGPEAESALFNLTLAADRLVNPNPPAVFYVNQDRQLFIFGVYSAWGAFVLSRLVLYIVPKVGRKEQAEVSAEYRRLMKGALDGGTVDLRENA